MPKISVVMSVYNGEKYIKDSIESILNQTYKNFEFIIINDGSTDESLSILNKYAKEDNRIIIVSRENRGLAYSLNEGIKLAKGKYIARMDADDISNKFRFEKQIEYLEKNPDIDILGSFVEIFGDDTDEDFSIVESWFNIKFNNMNIEKILLKNGCCIAHSAIIMKKDIFKILSQYKEEYLCEDYNLWLRALKNGLKLGKMEEKLIKMRRTKNSLSKLGNKQFNMLRDIYLNKLSCIDWNKYTFINKYILWGASNGGKIAEEVITKKFPNAKCVGYIDSFKEGNVNGINIFKPMDLINLEFDYIFVATSTGRDMADEFLEKKLNLKPIEEFFWLA